MGHTFKMKYIIGIGNYLMCDDSIGVRVVEYIFENNLENDFQAVDLSTNYINLLTYFTEDTSKILIVDAAKMGKVPGEYRFILPEEIKGKKFTAISSHENDVMKILERSKLMKLYIPPITFMGIEPEVVKQEYGLSDTLQNNLEKYAKTAISFIEG